MLNMTVYLNKIKEFEGSVGFPIINGEELAKTLQTAWKQDATEAKLDYLGAYREVFLGVLKKWSDSELSFAFSMRSEKMPDLKKCLLETDKALKLCAMALLPELRENLDVLSNMTFGVMDTQRLKNEFVTIRKKYLEVKEPENVTKKRKETAYVKYQKEWEKTTTRNITEMVRDQEALRLMSQDEKIDYALALDAYRHAEDLKRPLGSSEKELIDDALQAWKYGQGRPDGRRYRRMRRSRQHFLLCQRAPYQA